MTGPAVRYSLNEVDRYVKNNQDLKISVLQSIYVYLLAVEMKRGALPLCKDPDWWNSVEWIGMSSLTIDKSRDSVEARNNVKSGLMTLSSYCQLFNGRNWQEMVHQRVIEQEYVKEICEAHGENPYEVFPSLMEATRDLNVPSSSRGNATKEAGKRYVDGNPAKVFAIHVHNNIRYVDYLLRPSKIDSALAEGYSRIMKKWERALNVLAKKF